MPFLLAYPKHLAVATIALIVAAGAVQDAHDDILLVPGVEFTTYDGHANGIGATEYVDHRVGFGNVTIIGAAQRFAEQGALFSGIATTPSGTVRVLDPEALLRSERMRELVRAEPA